MLQRAALQYYGQLVFVPAVDPAHSGVTSDGHQATRPHLIRSVTWALVASEVTSRFQTSYIGVQVAARQNPLYLADDCNLIADCRCHRLHSANALTVPWTYTRLGDRSFSVAAPKVWNSLPATLRKPNNEFVQFKRLLKAFLFGETAAHKRLFVYNALCINWLTHSTHSTLSTTN